MKRLIPRGAAIAVTLVGLLAVAGCIEGDVGPAGPAGPAGSAGPTGAAGLDANQTCTECHTGDTDLKVRQVQWAASTHAKGGNFERGDDAACAACHAHEGFVDRIATGEQSASQGFDNPSPINCRTCHQIHTTYTDADYALTTTAPVDLWINGETIDLGDGNLCAQCHQPRVPSPLPAMGGADVTITSGYWGTHYGTQSTVLAATGGYEFTGPATYPTAPHFHGDVSVNPDGCSTCHMAAAYGAQSGGHTMYMAYMYHGSATPNTDGCEECHSSAADWDDFDYGNVQTDVEALLGQLSTKLLAVGIMDATGHAVPGTWTSDQAGALMNYLLLHYEGSDGVHNPTYVKALLTNTIAALP